MSDLAVSIIILLAALCAIIRFNRGIGWG